jgi:hypothetical protein
MNFLEKMDELSKQFSELNNSTTNGPAGSKPEAWPAKVEPAKVEPAKVEPAKVEPAKVEPAKVEPAKVEPTSVKVEPAQTKQNPPKWNPPKWNPSKWSRSKPPNTSILKAINDAHSDWKDETIYSFPRSEVCRLSSDDDKEFTENRYTMVRFRNTICHVPAAELGVVPPFIAEMLDEHCVLVGVRAASIAFKSKIYGDMFELYFVGVSEDEAIRRTNKFETILDKTMGAWASATVVKCKEYISFGTETDEIRVYTKIYPSLEKLLYSIPFGAAAVAYDGKEMWASAYGCLAYERGILIADGRKADCYAKACNVGFAVVSNEKIPEIGPNMQYCGLKISNHCTAVSKNVLVLETSCHVIAHGEAAYGTEAFMFMISNSFTPNKLAANVCMHNMQCKNDDDLVSATSVLENDDLCFDALDEALKLICSGSRIEFDTLSRLLGKEAAKELAMAVISGVELDYTKVAAPFTEKLYAMKKKAPTLKFTIMS